MATNKHSHILRPLLYRKGSWCKICFPIIPCMPLNVDMRWYFFNFLGPVTSQMFQMENSSTSGWTLSSLINKGPVNWHMTPPFHLHQNRWPWQEPLWQHQWQVAPLVLLSPPSTRIPEWAGPNITVVGPLVQNPLYPLLVCSGQLWVQATRQEVWSQLFIRARMIK